MDKWLERRKLPKFIQKEIDTVNNPIFIKEISLFKIFPQRNSSPACLDWWILPSIQGRNNTNITQGLEKEMATHSSVLAWRIPGTGEPGGLPSMGSNRVGHDWSNLTAAAATQGFQKKEDKEILPTSFCEGSMWYQHWTRILYEGNTTINKQISPLNTYIKFMTQNISTKLNSVVN